MLLAVMFQYVIGEQIRVIHVSELISYNDNFSSSSGKYNDSGVCCVYGNCTCHSLDYALANLISNVLINITTDVMLFTLIERSDLYNVSITGYNNPTVNCKNTAGIHFNSCYNCMIQGIAWNECGSTTKAGLMLNDHSNVIIQNCSFQNSLGQALVLSDVSGDVTINNCNFVNNSLYRGHGAAVHCYSNKVKSLSTNFIFNISNCTFSHNKQVKSVLYIENRLQQCNAMLYNLFFRIIKVCLFFW